MLKYKWLINGYFTELEAFDHVSDVYGKMVAMSRKEKGPSMLHLENPSFCKWNRADRES